MSTSLPSSAPSRSAEKIPDEYDGTADKKNSAPYVCAFKQDAKESEVDQTTSGEDFRSVPPEEAAAAMEWQPSAFPPVATQGAAAKEGHRLPQDAAADVTHTVPASADVATAAAPNNASAAPAEDLLQRPEIPVEHAPAPPPAVGGMGKGDGVATGTDGEEAERRKRKREQWEAQQAARRSWDLQRRVAEISSDVEMLTKEVARLKGELGSQPPLTRGAEQELAAVQASRAARLADTVRSHCKKAVLHITAHKWCWPFNHPVDTNVYKDYLTMVKTPMDFSTVKRKIDQGLYCTPDEFLEDVLLIFSNARTYNKPGSDVHVMANTIQEKFEDKYASLVLPRVHEVLAWSRAESEEVRRRHAGAMGRQEEWEGLEQRCEVLLRYIDEVAGCIADTKSAAAALCSPVSREEKVRLCQSLASLPQDYFEMAMALVLKDHPGLHPNDDIGLDVDALDALTLRQMQSFVKAFEAEKKVGGGAKAMGGSSSSRVLWPGLVIGAGLKPLPKRPPQQQQGRPAGGEDKEGAGPAVPGGGDEGEAGSPLNQPCGAGAVSDGHTQGGGAAAAEQVQHSPRAPGKAAAAARDGPGAERASRRESLRQRRSASPAVQAAAQQGQRRAAPPPKPPSPSVGGGTPRKRSAGGAQQGARQQQEALVARQASIASNTALLQGFPMTMSREGSVTGPAALHPFFLQIPQNPAAASAMALTLQMMQHQQQIAAAAAAAAAVGGRPAAGATTAAGAAAAPAAGIPGTSLPQLSQLSAALPLLAGQKGLLPSLHGALPMQAAALEGLAAQLRLPPAMAAQMLGVAAAAASVGGSAAASAPVPAASMLGSVPAVAGAAGPAVGGGAAQQAQILSQMHQLLTKAGLGGSPAAVSSSHQRPTASLHMQQTPSSAAPPSVPPPLSAERPPSSVSPTSTGGKEQASAHPLP